MRFINIKCKLFFFLQNIYKEMRKIEIQYFKFSTLDYSIEFKHLIVLNLIVFFKKITLLILLVNINGI